MWLLVVIFRWAMVFLKKTRSPENDRQVPWIHLPIRSFWYLFDVQGSKWPENIACWNLVKMHTSKTENFPSVLRFSLYCPHWHENLTIYQTSSIYWYCMGIKKICPTRYSICTHFSFILSVCRYPPMSFMFHTVSLAGTCVDATRARARTKAGLTRRYS